MRSEKSSSGIDCILGDDDESSWLLSLLVSTVGGDVAMTAARVGALVVGDPVGDVAVNDHQKRNFISNNTTGITVMHP